MESNIKRIGVIGMGRSGTSFLARFLATCGVYVDSASADKCEHPLGRRINDTVLAQFYGAKQGLPYGELPEDEIDVPDEWHEQAREFVAYMDRQAKENGKLPYWAFKDPRTTVLHRLWIRHFDIVVGIYRMPDQVVESYMAKKWIKGFRKTNIILGYWSRFNKALLQIRKELDGVKPMYIMDFNDDIEAQVTNLCAKLNIPMTEAAKAVFDRKQVHFSKPSNIKDKAILSLYDELKSTKNLL